MEPHFIQIKTTRGAGMSPVQKADTKEQILEVARELFATHGYNGASVRQIAEKAQVNIAAINYHFVSKEGLYWSVISDSMDWLSDSMVEAVSNSDRIEEVAVFLFRHLRKHNNFVNSCMKTFLSDMVPPPAKDHPYLQKLKENRFALPGGILLVEFLKKKYPKIDDKGAEWVAHSMFSSIMHLVSITSSSHYENIKKNHKPIKTIEKSLQLQSLALLQFALKNKDWEGC